MNDIQKALLDSINLISQEKSDNVGCNYYEFGSVVSNNGDGTYVVKINGDNHTFPIRAGLTLSVNNVVCIMCPNGNFSLGWIDLVRPY